MKRGLILDSKDNVGVLLEMVSQGEQAVFDSVSVCALETIQSPHKIALRDIKQGDLVIKYGGVIGYATKDILAGEHVHVHNVDSEQFMR